MRLGIREIAFCAAALAASSAWAMTAEEKGAAKEEAENFEYTTVTTPEGLTFRIPKDMPIEMRNGIQAPIPFDEYIYGKFATLSKRLDGMYTRLERMEKLLAELQERQEGAKALKTA